MRNQVFIFICSFLFCSCRGQESKLSPQVFLSQITNSSSKVILDVRTKEEFGAGYIDQAINIDWNEKTFEELTEKLDKNTPVYIYCLSGGRSGNAAKNLRTRGFKHVLELTGGIMAWRAENLKLVTLSSAELKDMTKAEFEKLYRGKAKKVLIDFYADWCGPCKKMKPFLDEFEKSKASELEIIRLNADQFPNLCAELRVTGLPCFMLFQHDKMVWKRLGYIEKHELNELLSK